MAFLIRLLLLATLCLPISAHAADTVETRAILQAIIGELQEEKVVAARYSDPLRREIQRQRAFIFPTLKAAGPLKDLRFRKVTHSGSGQPIRQFLATHENTQFQWTVSLDARDVVTLLLLQPAD